MENYEGGMLPDYHAVVFDEAHEIEDVVGQYFGVSISNYRFQDLRRDLRRDQPDEEVRYAGIGPHPASAWMNSPGISSASSARATGAVAFTGRDAFREDNEEIYSDLLAALELIGSHLRLLQNPPEEIIPLFRRTQELNEGLRFLMEEDDENFVYWVEKRGRGCFLQATPIDVSEHRVQAAVPSGGHRSADLRHAGRGGRVRRSRKSAWAWRTRAPWWCRAISITRSRRCCMCRSTCRNRTIRPLPRWPPRKWSRSWNTAGGRAFVLFTSYQQMRLVYEQVSLRNRLPDADAGHRPAQRAAGRVPRHAQLRAFRDLLLLAGRGCAGRAVELRYHR